MNTRERPLKHVNFTKQMLLQTGWLRRFRVRVTYSFPFPFINQKPQQNKVFLSMCVFVCEKTADLQNAPNNHTIIIISTMQVYIVFGNIVSPQIHVNQETQSKQRNNSTSSRSSNSMSMNTKLSLFLWQTTARRPQRRRQ